MWGGGGGGAGGGGGGGGVETERVGVWVGFKRGGVLRTREVSQQ